MRSHVSEWRVGNVHSQNSSSKTGPLWMVEHTMYDKNH
jgi:hypothetical protein